MSRVRRRTALGALSLAATLAFGLSTPPVAATPGQDPATTSTTVVGALGGAETEGDTAIADLAACIQGSRRLAVVFLIDESGSLGKSDPDNLRVDAARAALDSLATLTQGPTAARSEVDVTLAAFSNQYRTVQEWTPVTADAQPVLGRTLETFRQLNQGTDTDFVNALAGARQALADRSAELTADGGAAPCKAVLLFTDGSYDIGVRDASNIERLGNTKPYAPGIELDSEANARRVEAAGRASLCDEGGLADGVRGDDITLLTVALTGRNDPEALRFLSAVSTGETEGVTCGRPTDNAPGAYVAAADVNVLVARFDEVAVRIAGGSLIPGAEPKLCGEDDCAAGTRTVAIDRSVRRLRILALAPRPGMTVGLSGPGGTAEIDRAGEVEIGSATATSRSIAGRGYAIEIERPADDADWTGSWTFVLHDPTGEQLDRPAILSVYLFTDVGIGFDPAPILVRGEAVEIAAVPVVPESVTADLAGAEVVLRLDDPISGASTSLPLAGPPNGPYTATVTTPTDYRSSFYEASLELRATTRDGAAVEARSAPSVVVVRRAAGSMQYAPPQLELPSVTGTGSSSTGFVLLGGDEAGCVWFGPSKAEAPDAAGAIEVTYAGRAVVGEADCIEVPAGGNVTIDIEVSPEQRATGAVRGRLEVFEKTGDAEASVTDVPFSVDLAVGIDQTRRLFLAIALLAAGILLPLLLLVAINAATARFQALDAVRGAVLPVRVDGQMLYRMDGRRARPFTFSDDDFRSLEGTGDVRRFTFGGIVFRTKASRNPFGETAALGAPEGGAERLQGKAGSRVELETSLAGSWIFLLDPDRTRAGAPTAAEGNLIAFVAEGDSRPQFAKIVPDIEERLPGTASRLGALVRGKASLDAASAKPSKGTESARTKRRAARTTEAETDPEVATAPDADGAGGAIDPGSVSDGPPPVGGD